MLRRLAAVAVAALLILAGSAPAAAAQEDTLYTAEGYAIGMRVSASYDAGAALEQGVLATLNGLLHGPELANLRVVIETPEEVARDCGSADALACYGENEMLVPGVALADAPPVPFLIAHEYAHHILAHRRNDPWFASDWGAKRWASAMRVCPSVRGGELFLGYWTIPAEAFAESYAAMLFPDVHYTWGYDLRLTPTQAAKTAIRADVLQPWQGPTVERFSGRLARGGKRVTRIALPLDGDAKFSVSASRPVELALLNGRRVLASARGRRPRLSYSFCGRRRVTLRLSAPAGAASFRLTTSRP
jgi:hypothetical protein